MTSVPPILAPPVNRRRWWIHLLLIAGYLLAVGALGLGRQHSHSPALLHTARGLLLVCGFELLLFGLVFGLAWLASRASSDALRLRWRGTFQPVLFGVGYSVALRMALGMVLFLAAMGLILFHFLSLNSLQTFLAAHRPNVETVVDLSALSHDPVYFWLTLTVASFGVAGLREELWRSAFLAGMQALWPQHFGNRAGQMRAVLIAAIIFGSAHVSMGGAGGGHGWSAGPGVGGHHGFSPFHLARGHCPRFVRCHHVCHDPLGDAVY